MSELYHHGIPGQKWGRRHGPPYPLDRSDYSIAERNKAIKDKYKGYLDKANTADSKRASNNARIEKAYKEGKISDKKAEKEYRSNNKKYEKEKNKNINKYYDKVGKEQDKIIKPYQKDITRKATHLAECDYDLSEALKRYRKNKSESNKAKLDEAISKREKAKKEVDNTISELSKNFVVNKLDTVYYAKKGQALTAAVISGLLAGAIVAPYTGTTGTGASAQLIGFGVYDQLAKKQEGKYYNLWLR